MASNRSLTSEDSGPVHYEEGIHRLLTLTNLEAERKSPNRDALIYEEDKKDAILAS